MSARVRVGSGWPGTMRGGAGLLLVLALLAGCAVAPGPDHVPDPEGDPEQDSPPLVDRPGLESLPDPEPRWEPLARRGNHSPYEVFGQRYFLLPTAQGYAEEGLASWYGQKFHGRQTSSGEPYDMFELTAAHRYLPLPTYVRVTNLENDRTTIVRVNDRGPFHADRIIDLSYGAAVKLGFMNQGTALVKVEAIVPDERPLPTLALPADAVESAADDNERPPPLWLQAGAFGSPVAAEALRDRLDGLLSAASEDVGVKLLTGDDDLIRVRVGPLDNDREAGRLQALLQEMDAYGRPLIVRD